MRDRRLGSRPDRLVHQSVRTHILAAVRLFTCQRALYKRRRRLSSPPPWSPPSGEAKSYRSIRRCQSGVARIFTPVRAARSDLQIPAGARVIGVRRRETSLPLPATMRPNLVRTHERQVRCHDQLERVVAKSNGRRRIPLCRSSLTAADSPPMAGREIICQLPRGMSTPAAKNSFATSGQERYAAATDGVHG